MEFVVDKSIKIKRLVVLPLVLALAINLGEILIYFDTGINLFNTPRSTSVWLIVYRIISIFLFCFTVLYLNVFKTDEWLKKVKKKYVPLGHIVINGMTYMITFIPFVYIQDEFILKLHNKENNGLAFVWLIFMVICVLAAYVIKLRTDPNKALTVAQQAPQDYKQDHNSAKDKEVSQQNYLTSFLLPKKKVLEPVKVDQFAVFFIDEGIVKGKTFDSKTYVIEKNIQELENNLDPRTFFRTNRQYLIHRNAVKYLQPESYGKMDLALKVDHENIVISKLKSKQFKEWLVEI